MAIQSFATQTGRINKIKGEILAHAVPVEVLGITGAQRLLPANKGDTVVFRRYLPFGGVDNRWITPTTAQTFAASHQLSEGVTPAADTVSATDISVTLQQYGVLYALTDRTADLYEDNLANEMVRQVGERIGEVREMIRYGAVSACTNALYAGGNSRATVDTVMQLAGLRLAARILKSNHARQITRILDASPDFNTAPIEAGYLVFCHTDLEADIRNLPGFVKTAEYGTRKPINDHEIGSCESFRFILSPELVQHADAGASVGATGCESTSGVHIDVFPVIIVGEDAWGQVALRGADSFEATYIQPGVKDKNDPLGQRGYIGASFYFNCTVLNQGWLCVYEVGASALTA